MLITNNSNTMLGLPDSTYLQPKEAREVDAFICANRVVRGWIDAGILSASEAPAAAEEEAEAPEQTIDPEQAEKDELIAQLKEMGISRDRRTSIDRLKELLEVRELSE